VIDGATRARLIAEDPKSAEIIKPFLRGRDVKRWRLEPQDLWLIFTRRGININQYPSIRKYLKQFRDQLEPKPNNWDDTINGAWSGRKPGSYEWYEIQDNIAYWQEFEKPKIFVPAIEDGVNYAPDLKGYYGNDKTNIIVSNEWKYLLALLNSSVSWWLTKQTFSGKQGGFYEFKPMYVSRIPIPSASNHQKPLIEAIVTAILAPTTLTPEPSPACGRGEWERLINGLVYELFFPDDLHQANIHLFDTAARAGLDRLATLDGSALADAASEIATAIFASSHPIQGMLTDLQKLEVVRVIEGRD